MSKIQFAPGAKSRCLLIASLLWLANNNEAYAQNFWQQTNGPFGGNIKALAINANGHIFAGTGYFFEGTDGGGIFRSTDNGGSWTVVNNGLTSTEILALAISSNGDIFAGTFGGGVARSTNNGDTWESVNTGLTNLVVRSLAINPATRDIFAGTNGGVFRSINNGSSWMPVNNGLTTRDVLSLAINSSGHIFAGTFLGGLFQSTNNGGSWAAVNNGLTATNIFSLAINSRGEIFAGTILGGVFRSTNNGGSWMPVNNGLTTRNVLSLAINSSGHIFAGTFLGGLFQSTNNGGNWAAVNTGLTNPVIPSLAINSSSGHIFAGTLGSGVFRSMDNGGSWAAVNTGLTGTDVQALSINSSGHIFAGTVGGGVFRSTDNGDSWTPVNNGLTNSAGVIQSLAINSSGHLFAGTAFDGVFRSTNNGNNWTAVNNGLTNLSIQALAINSSSGNIFAGTDSGGVFRSTDNGGSWTAVNTGLTNPVVASLAINSSGHIFAGTAGGVFRSTDNGNSWTAANSGLTNLDVAALAVNSSGHIFAGTNGGGAFRSTNNGGSWTAVNKGLVIPFVLSFNINLAGIIFAGTGGGVFRSLDNGDNWTPVNDGLTRKIVLSLAINSMSGNIFAGTIGGGVFRSTQSTLAPIVTTNAATSVSTTSATLNGTVNANGSIARVVFEYGSTTSYGSSVPADPNIVAGTDLFSVKALVTALSPGTTYHFRVVATNGAGTTNGSDQTFTTNRLPTVVNPIPNQTLAVGGPPFTRDLNASAPVFNDPDGEMLSYTAGSSATNIATVNLSGSALTVSPVSAGSATISVTANDGRGGTVSTTFGVTVNPKINQPPVITVTPLPSSPSGQQITVQANITDDTGIAGATLNYRRGGDANFTAIAMSPSGNLFQGTIPASAVTSRGVDHFIVATDLENAQTRQPGAGVFSIQIQFSNEAKPTAQPNGSAQNAYRLISVPLQLNDSSPAAVLVDDLGSYDNTVWRLFGLLSGQPTSNKSAYAEFPNAGAFASGQSLFLIVRDPSKIVDSGPGQSVRTDQVFSLTLAVGHNLVANPFNFDIPLNKLQLQSGGAVALQTYDGSWRPAEVFSPWEGYYLANNRATTDVLSVNPNLSSGSSKNTGVTNFSLSGWRVQISASCAEARDTYNFAGVATNSADGWDDTDLVEPPPIGEYVSVYFPHEEWQKPLVRYSDDIRSPSNPNQRWRFVVESNIPNQLVALRFDQLQALDPALAFVLVDEALNYKQNLREKPAYQYQPRRREDTQIFTLVVGKEDFVAEQTAHVQGAPENFVLEQNFPNPFSALGTSASVAFGSSETAIRFGLPQQSAVTIKIFDLAGREIATLLDRVELPAGRHQRVWDGRDRQGQAVVSGIYFYQLIAGSFSKTMKLMLVR